MEGTVGSRVGRSSSRYATAVTTPPVFNGPVRKWKRKWVQVSAPPSTGNNISRSKANNNNDSRLLLCRWTPLTPAASPSAPASDSAAAEEPPKRKFRYTPIAVLEEQRKAAAKTAEQEAKTGGKSTGKFKGREASKNFELKRDKAPKKEETQDSNISDLDLGLYLKGHTDSHSSFSHGKDVQKKKGSSGGFWMIG